MNAYVLAERPTALLVTPDLKKNIVMANLQPAQAESRNRIASLNKDINETINPLKKAELQSELAKLVNELHPSCVAHYLGKEWHYNDFEENKIAKFFALSIYLFAVILALCVFGYRINEVIQYQLHQL